MICMRKDYELFTKNTQAIIYGFHQAPIQRMLDFDYVCGRKTPSIAAIVAPNRSGFHKVFFGGKEIPIPIYTEIKDAAENHKNADVLINFASFRSAFQTTLDALNEKTLKTIVIIAEGIPERHTRELICVAEKFKKTIIGPATVGGIAAGAFKIGNTGGTIENILASKLNRPGCVGLVSKSGGMVNEMFNVIARNTNGLVEGIAIGGDRFPGTTLLDHVLRFEANPKIKMIVCLGEVGGMGEYKIVNAIKEGKIKKPIVIWVTGTCATVFPSEVQFGHAGAKSGDAKEGAKAKNRELKAAGAVVPDSFDDFGEKIKDVYEKLKKDGLVQEFPEPEVPRLPMDFKDAVERGIVRRPTSVISTVSDERGDELTYNKVPISKILTKNYSIGDVIGLLWFKKKLPKFASEFIETVLIIVADHGPAVAGAHNAIVASRAGKGLVTSVCSGLLTIGPRFGGAITDAARYFKRAYDSGMMPEDFVKGMRAKNIYIPGIGHRVKSVKNPDKRVELLKNYARKNFPKTEYLNYALEVEKLTSAKKGNLILNVDGCIAVLLLDLMSNCKEFTHGEMDDIVESGGLNAFFVLGRTIGLISHVFDQRRLKTGLYRQPWDEIYYLDD